MRKKLLIVVVLIVVLILLIPLVFYLITRNQVGDQVSSGPNPTEENQKALADTTITRIFYGILPCEDCEGTETVLSLSNEEGDESGVFTISRTKLESSEGAQIVSGKWIFIKNDNNDDIVINLKLEDGNEVSYLQTEDNKLIQLDEDGSELGTEEENYTLDILE